MESIYNENFTLRQLSHFVAVAERGTVSGAALDLKMSQSAVSASLSELERALGAELCIRRKAHGVALTPTGTVVLGHARRLLGEARELGLLVKGGDSLVGPLVIGCLVTLAPTLLPPLVDQFPRSYPGVTLEFVEADQDTLHQALHGGQVDMSLLWNMEIPADWVFLPLFGVRPYVLVAGAHPLAARESVSLRELESEPLVLLDPPSGGAQSLEIMAAVGVRPIVRYRPRSFESARSLVGRELGWSMLFQRPRIAETYEGLPVVILEIEDDVPSIDFGLAWLRHARLSPRAEAFAQFAARADLYRVHIRENR